MIQAAALEGIPHGFSTREEPALDEVLPGAPRILARQIHSPDVLAVTAPWDGPPPAADALVTDRPGLLIGVVTADCAPVLMADAEKGVVGAAHAGWRGALGGILENTVGAMVALGARRDRIVAVIGPTIRQASYEVDAVFRNRLIDGHPDARTLFEPGRPGHYQFDLPRYVGHRLLVGAGISAAHDLAEDTYAQPERFFSFRRATHRGEPTGGRQISVVGLP